MKRENNNLFCLFALDNNDRQIPLPNISFFYGVCLPIKDATIDINDYIELFWNSEFNLVSDVVEWTNFFKTWESTKIEAWNDVWSFYPWR